ncbi:pyridoxal phosphate-dependent aminotransferase [Nocardia gipuzkoensis]
MLKAEPISLFAELFTLPRASPEPLESTRPVRGTDAVLFCGEPLDELSTAIEHSPDPADTATVFSTFLQQLGAGHPNNPTWSPTMAKRLVNDVSLPWTRPIMPSVVKMVFDYYFRDDLYQLQLGRQPIILSSGSSDETIFGLPDSLKDCVRVALGQNWYGYSDSLGRTSARNALARLESSRFSECTGIEAANVAVTLGGTAAVSALVDLIAGSSGQGRSAVACVPNYPPLVAAMSRRLPVTLANLSLDSSGVDVSDVITAMASRPRLVLLQTVINPWGRRISEAQLETLIAALPIDCYLILDECHDAFGPAIRLTPARRDPRVISVRSLSKQWAAPGFKAGWIVASENLIAELYSYASTNYGGPPSLLYLFLEMFAIFEQARLSDDGIPREQQTYLCDTYGLSSGRVESGLMDYLSGAAAMHNKVVRRRRYAVERLMDGGVETLAPEYSINIFTRFGSMPSYQLYRRLVEDAGVSIYPGILCMTDTRGTARISPNIPEDILESALDRVLEWHRQQAY